jgi:predicted transcriptional regulator
MDLDQDLTDTAEKPDFVREHTTAGEGRLHSGLKRDKNGEMRRGEVLRLRREGLTEAQIAERLGYTPKTVYKYLRRALHAAYLDDAQELTKLEDQRLDALFNVYFTQALDGDQRAGDLCLKIMDRRAQMRGLDAPKKVETREEVHRIATVRIELPPQVTSVTLPEPAKSLPQSEVIEGEIVNE